VGDPVDAPAAGVLRAGAPHRADALDPALDEEIRAGFEDTIAAVAAIPLPLADAVSDPVARQQVIELVERLKALRALIRGPVASGLGLSIGFNATDGD
jgi:predicted lipoprotein